ncbi:hypothetical protein, partial [Desulfofundulus thermosubterraneus]|uniref:hypothetical protein n=1 Tax=Desulfofundulus thermosubterraneus TaxID=348840 RepID=UPI001A96FCBA
ASCSQRPGSFCYLPEVGTMGFGFNWGLATVSNKNKEELYQPAMVYFTVLPEKEICPFLYGKKFFELIKVLKEFLNSCRSIVLCCNTLFRFMKQAFIFTTY